MFSSPVIVMMVEPFLWTVHIPGCGSTDDAVADTTEEKIKSKVNIKDTYFLQTSSKLPPPCVFQRLKSIFSFFTITSFESAHQDDTYN